MQSIEGGGVPCAADVPMCTITAYSRYCASSEPSAMFGGVNVSPNTTLCFTFCSLPRWWRNARRFRWMISTGGQVLMSTHFCASWYELQLEQWNLLSASKSSLLLQTRILSEQRKDRASGAGGVVQATGLMHVGLTVAGMQLLQERMTRIGKRCILAIAANQRDGTRQLLRCCVVPPRDATLPHDTST